MSLIIKGIDLPKHDEGIRLAIWKDGLVYARDIKTDTTIRGEIEAIQIPTPHGRLGDIDELNRRMYHEAFETDTILQKWDGGCWIRYKLFEILRDTLPTILKGEYE